MDVFLSGQYGKAIVINSPESEGVNILIPGQKGIVTDE